MGRRTGARILNTGSWVYQPHFLSPEPNGSPYWPGTAVIVDDEGPPRLVRLLGERGHDVAQAARPRVKQVAWTVTPSPTTSSELALGVARVLDQRRSSPAR